MLKPLGTEHKLPSPYEKELQTVYGAALSVAGQHGLHLVPRRRTVPMHLLLRLLIAGVQSFMAGS